VPQGVVVRVHSRAPRKEMEGRLAQLVRAAALHAVGLGFESLVAHLSSVPPYEQNAIVRIGQISID